MIILLFLLHATWQQRVSYEIEARLNTDDHTLSASAELTYQNNSPGTLDTIYFYLHAEAFRQRETGHARAAEPAGDPRCAPMAAEDRGGMTVDRVASAGRALRFNITETIMAVLLPGSLMPGDSVAITIDYSLWIPKERRGFGYWPGHYEMTNWYPKVCVYDRDGWHVESVHPLSGTYGEFGRYEVVIDLPSEFFVAATGRQAEHAGQTRTGAPDDARDETSGGVRQRVRFVADNVHDFIWVCDQGFERKDWTIGQTTVAVVCREENEVHAENAGRYAVDAVERFDQWFGLYPHGNIDIVDGFYEGNMSFPQVVIINMQEDRLTRVFEAQLAGKIAAQWFDGVIGVDGSKNAWLGQGLAAYAAIRYMEDKYGAANSLVKTSLLPPFSLEYYHRLYYYLVQTNQLERSISAPAESLGDLPTVYENSIRSKPALFLRSLESIFGQDRFDQMLRQYFREHAFRHARPEDLIDACRRLSDHDLAPVFDSFINTTELCDWAVGRVSAHTVEIENRGGLKIPVRVLVRTESGKHDFDLDGREDHYRLELPRDAGEITGVEIDPSAGIMEAERWNNYFPRRVSVKPVWDFDWPSFCTYQILWSPYVWYNHFDGVKAGIYVFGDKFADFDYVKGGYQTTAGYVRGFGSNRDYPMLNYQTPLVFRDGLRVRLRFSAARSQGGDHIGLGFASRLGRPFAPRPQVEITNMLAYDGLFTFAGVDSIDWELGKNVSIDNHFRFRHAALDVDARLAFAHQWLGSDWQYLKSTFEIKRSFNRGVPVTIRLFVGKIFGTAPLHEQFFLSGGLRTNWLGNLLFGQSGPYSPQECLHVPGDGNMRGYQTLHIKSGQMYALNLEFPARSLVRVFSDIGYHDRFAFDAGLRLVIGSETISAIPVPGLSIALNLPLYAYVPGEPWKMHWSLSLGTGINF